MKYLYKIDDDVSIKEAKNRIQLLKSQFKVNKKNQRVLDHIAILEKYIPQNSKNKSLIFSPSYGTKEDKALRDYYMSSIIAINFLKQQCRILNLTQTIIIRLNLMLKSLLENERKVIEKKTQEFSNQLLKTIKKL